MGEGLVVLDGGLRVALSNSRLRRLTGMSEAALGIGMPFAQVLAQLEEGGDIEVDGDTSDAAARMVFDHFAAALPFRFEVRRSTGRVLMVRANPLPEGGWVCVFTDITAARSEARRVGKEWVSTCRSRGAL